MRFLFDSPRPNYDVAFSGGVDSTCLLMYTKLALNKHVRAIYVNHGHTDVDSEAEADHVLQFCRLHDIPLVQFTCTTPAPHGCSLEQFWRSVRYDYLDKVGGAVATGHHLDDVVESYLFSTLHGQPKVIPYRRNNVIRPMLTIRKQEAVDWCVERGYNWFSATPLIGRPKQLIRDHLIPSAVQVHPHLYSTMRNKVIKRGTK